MFLFDNSITYGFRLVLNFYVIKLVDTSDLKFSSNSMYISYHHSYDPICFLLYYRYLWKKFLFTK